MSAEIIAEPLNNVINATMLDEQIFRDVEKEVSVTPGLKKEDTQTKTNYFQTAPKDGKDLRKSIEIYNWWLCFKFWSTFDKCRIYYEDVQENAKSLHWDL